MVQRETVSIKTEYKTVGGEGGRRHALPAVVVAAAAGPGRAGGIYCTLINFRSL